MFKVVTRGYASEAAKGLDPMFLSNLLKRIDRINAQASEAIKESKGPQRNRFKPVPKQTAKPQIQVKNHPLANNTFQLMDEANFKRGPRRPQGRRFQGERPQGERYQGERPQGERRYQGERPQGERRYQKERPQGERRYQGERPQGERRTQGRGQGRPARRPPVRKAREAAPVRGQEITSKKLVYETFTPGLKGETFLYGKPVSLITGNVGSGVSAVTKQFLIDSKYPYQLPKSVVELVDPTFKGNKFILQKNWNTDVDAKQLAQRINDVVKGRFVTSLVDESVFKKPESVKRAHGVSAELVRNGDLSFDQKQVIYDVANGFTSPKALLETAHWN